MMDVSNKPRRLKRGDLVAIVAPASPVADAARIEKGVRYLEGLGYSVIVGKHARNIHGYLAGSDDVRLADLSTFFEDRRVKAIIALRGGYGTSRLLSKVNYRIVKRNPKIIVGFSDLTALQLALWRKCRLITFHGPMAAVEMADTMDPFTEELFWRLVTSTKKIGRVTFPPETQPTTLHKGMSRGRLVGGNLSLIVSLLGTPYFPDPAGAIIFLEEIAEEPYRIDRMFTHLSDARVFSKCAGVLAGQFTDCIPSDPKKPSLAVSDILHDFASRTARPFLANLPFGHVHRKMTIPIGLSARMNSTARTLEYLEAAVVD